MKKESKNMQLLLYGNQPISEMLLSFSLVLILEIWLGIRNRLFFGVGVKYTNIAIGVLECLRIYLNCIS